MEDDPYKGLKAGVRRCTTCGSVINFTAEGGLPTCGSCGALVLPSGHPLQSLAEQIEEETYRAYMDGLERGD